MRTLTKIGLGIVILFLLMVVLGGSSSNNQEKAHVQNPATSAVSPVATEQKPAETPVTVSSPTEPLRSTTPEYQDSDWAKSSAAHMNLISTDLANIGTALKDQNYNSMGLFGQNLIDDTQAALDESEKYNTSSKPLEAKQEWELTLKDYNSAGKVLIQMSDEGKNGTSDVEKIKGFTSFMNSGNGHMSRATALIKAAYP